MSLNVLLLYFLLDSRQYFARQHLKSRANTFFVLYVFESFELELFFTKPLNHFVSHFRLEFRTTFRVAGQINLIKITTQSCLIIVLIILRPFNLGLSITLSISLFFRDTITWQLLYKSTFNVTYLWRHFLKTQCSNVIEIILLILRFNQYALYFLLVFQAFSMSVYSILKQLYFPWHGQSK